MKERLENMPNYMKEHRKELLLVLGGSCLCAVGFMAGRKSARNLKKIGFENSFINDEGVRRWIERVDKAYPKRGNYGAFHTDIPIALDDLGKMGEEIRELGETRNLSFTHALLIGGK